MNSKKSFLWLLFLVFILAIVVGCSGNKSGAAIDVVPQNVNLLADIQVSKIINDKDLQDAYDEATKESDQPQTVEEALNELFEETGIDLHDFSQAVIFADITTLEQADYLGIIIEGTFNEEQFIDNIEREIGEEFTTSKYKDYTLYTDEEEEFGIAFLSDRMLLFGTTKAVKDAIDVNEGVRDQVGGAILDTYNQLGDALIKLTFELPEEARRALAEEPVSEDIPISLETFTDVDILGFALNKEADTITVQITPHFLSTDSAEDAKDTLGGAISLFKGMIQVPEMKELLDKIEVTVTDSWVTIALEITLSEIESLAEDLQP